jgi:hypothetical protein
VAGRERIEDILWIGRRDSIRTRRATSLDANAGLLKLVVYLEAEVEIPMKMRTRFGGG